MAETITEAQGRKIISLLEDIVSALRDLNNEVTKLDSIHDELRDVNGHLGPISFDVNSIERSQG